MRCPKCGCQDDKVIDSRSSREGAAIRRRRECTGCEHRYTTYEIIERPRLMVVKRDGRSEEFSRDKLTASILKSCQKRPVTQEAIGNLVEQVVDVLSNEFDREVPYGAIGARVMDGLRSLDPVAYVRYTSIYRRFDEATDFVQEVKKLRNLMILLRPDCLVFETPSGGHVPCSVKEVTIEFIGETEELLDRELLENAAAAVLHYFRVEQKKESVTVAEFTEALEKVLCGLGLKVKPAGTSQIAASERTCVESDLCLLAGEGCELFFFPRLRDEIRRRLDGTPLVLRFHGLRACVRHLTGAKRWSSQCRRLNDQIVDYLRNCFVSEKAGAGSALVVH